MIRPVVVVVSGLLGDLLTAFKKKMMAAAARVAFLLAFVVQLGAPAAIDVVHLDAGSFEHDTQAATGATTGDWVVKFYTHGCAECDAMSNDWGEMALNVKVFTQRTCGAFLISRNRIVQLLQKSIVPTAHPSAIVSSSRYQTCLRSTQP